VKTDSPVTLAGWFFRGYNNTYQIRVQVSKLLRGLEIEYTEWPKKYIHFLLINIFGINLNEISISG